MEKQAVLVRIDPEACGETPRIAEACAARGLEDIRILLSVFLLLGRATEGERVGLRAVPGVIAVETDPHL